MMIFKSFLKGEGQLQNRWEYLSIPKQKHVLLSEYKISLTDYGKRLINDISFKPHHIGRLLVFVLVYHGKIYMSLKIPPPFFYNYVRISSKIKWDLHCSLITESIQ